MTEESSEERIKRCAQITEAGRLLVNLAKSGKIGPIFIRKDYVDRCLTYLSSENNILIVGEPGVGKNAIVESIALELAKEDSFSTPCAKEILEINATKLLEGCLYVGNLENKISQLLKNCVEENTILFFDDIHFGIGTWADSKSPYNDMINILNNSLLPDSKIIAATTPYGLKTLQKIHPQFVNKFLIVNVSPTDVEQTKKILHGIKTSIESRNKISIEDGVLDELVRLADTFYHWRRLPGKAFEILLKLISIRQNDVLTLNDLYKFIQEDVGLSEFILREDYRLNENDIKNYFKQFIFDQDEAIDEITNIILRFKTRLISPDKPVASFLFAGPSGVGKTELAKILASYLFNSKEKLLIYPMSQYKGEIGFRLLFGRTGVSINELIQGEAKLIKDVKTSPFSVILFDEIDQASREIFNGLYQILDEGRYIENNGDITSFKSTIIIMTTNIGMEKFCQKKVGFKEADSSFPKEHASIHDDIIRELENYFGTPFLNRVNKIIIFRPLSKTTVKKIVLKSLEDLTQSLPGLKNRELKIKLDDNLVDLIAEEGYSEKYGARNVHKILENYIIKPIASYLANEPQLNKISFYFYISENEIKFNLVSE